MPKAREGGEHKRGIIPPLVRGVWRTSPDFFFFEFYALLCAFLMGFYAFGTGF